MKIWEKREELAVELSLKSYIYSSVRNSCLNHLKHLKVRAEHATETKHTAPTSEMVQEAETEFAIQKTPFYSLYQVGFVPPLNNHGLKSGWAINNFSLNVFSGFAYGLEGIEVAAFTNILKSDMLGLQLAGFGNFICGEVQGLQGAEFFNTALNGTFGGQAAGFLNVHSGQFNGIQASGFANVSGDVNGIQAAPFLNVGMKVNGIQLGLNTTSIQLSKDGKFYNGVNLLNRATVSLGFDLVKGIDIFFAPSFNLLIREPETGNLEEATTEIAPFRFKPEPFGDSEELIQSWIGFEAGIRF